MVLSKKGQFFLLALVAMIIVVVGIAYYASESKELERQIQTPQEPFIEADINNYELQLQSTLENEVYSGASMVSAMMIELQEHANSTGRKLSISCDRGESGIAFTLNCTLTLYSGVQNITSYFNYSYVVPTNLTTFNDTNLEIETSYYKRGQTVYYRVIGNNNTGGATTTFNVSFFDEDWGLQHNAMHDIPLYAKNSSFTIDQSDGRGNWTAMINGSVYANISVERVNIEIDTYDVNNNPQDTFNKGDLVKYNVTVGYVGVGAVDFNVKMDVLNALSQQTNYGSQDNATGGVFSGNFTIGAAESAGNFTLRATEQVYFTQKVVEIIVLDAPYSGFIKILAPYFVKNTNASACFGRPGCGYTSWFGDTSVEYNSIPFLVNTSGNVSGKVNGSTYVVALPHVYADTIHFIASRCDTCV